MSTDWARVAKEFWDRQPHPQGHGLSIGDFPVAVKLATAARFGGHATAEQAVLFWKEFQNLKMTPDQFQHALDRLAPLSFAYHGRPPTMNEIKALGDARPGEVRKHFADLPDKDHPTVSAGEMVKALQSAKPHFHEHLGRPPTKSEGAYLVHSGEPAAVYAQRLKAYNSSNEQVPDPGGSGPLPSGHDRRGGDGGL